MSDEVIEIKGLSYSYGNRAVLEDIDLAVKSSDFLGIIGPNGGGKTTLLKLILGLLRPNKGSVSIFGAKPDKKNVGKIGYVPQSSAYDTHFPITVEDIILSGRIGNKGLFEGYSKEDKSVVHSTMKYLELSKYMSQCMCDLSGGERQRVLIARALVGEPEILLLDEPTSNMDKGIEKNFYELLANKNKEIPIIIISHDIGIISSHVNKIACLNKNLFYHDSKELTKEMIENTYHCPVEVIAHGVAHRVYPEHSDE